MSMYKLAGFLNMFDIIPDFVYPVFWLADDTSIDRLYLQEGNKDTIMNFVPLKESVYYKVVYYKELNKIEGMTVNDGVAVLDRAIYAFQIDSQNVICGDSEKLIQFFNNYSTNDKILLNEIKEFRSEIKMGFFKPKKKEVLAVSRINSRSNSYAEVYLVKGSGRVMVNNITIYDDLKNKSFIDMVKAPLVVTDNTDKFDIFIVTNIINLSMKTKLIRQGIARALCRIDSSCKKKLKDSGYLSPYRYAGRKQRQRVENKIIKGEEDLGGLQKEH